MNSRNKIYIHFIIQGDCYLTTPMVVVSLVTGDYYYCGTASLPDDHQQHEVAQYSFGCTYKTKDRKLFYM
jgi:hypothetical protein